ncbi:MAG: ABC transporter ATP-binding protein, partial [Planctomycetaceae bacterium]
VRNVSVSVNAGQFLAVQGPSGCGKTTLLLMAGGLLAPDAGTVLVGGTNPYELSPNRRATFRAEKIGFVFQQFHLVPYLSVFENVLAPSIALDRSNAPARAKELVAHFGLEHRLHHVPGQLSTGERQRTALARALLNEPKLLLADEPTGNLDPDNATIVLEHMKEFARSGGAVLLVTHDERAVGFADEIVRMRDGQLDH